MARQHDKRPCNAPQRLRQTVGWRILAFGVPSLGSCAAPPTGCRRRRRRQALLDARAGAEPTF
jgi:hypothetical protein